MERANAEYWSFVIPKSSKYKTQGWEFIRALSGHEGALTMALNGNNPLRQSVFEDPKFTEAVPFAAVAKGVAKNARVPLPAFDKSPQAMEMIDNYIERAMFGEMTPQAAMDELTKRLKELSDSLK